MSSRKIDQLFLELMPIHCFLDTWLQDYCLPFRWLLFQPLFMDLPCSVYYVSWVTWTCCTLNISLGVQWKQYVEKVHTLSP